MGILEETAALREVFKCPSGVELTMRNNLVRALEAAAGVGPQDTPLVAAAAVPEQTVSF